jgi:hypothetical protein
LGHPALGVESGGMTVDSTRILHYQLSFAGQPAGSQKLRLEPGRRGLRLLLEAQVDLPAPRTRQRWESQLGEEGSSRRYLERIEGREARSLEMEFLPRDGVVNVSQGRESFAVPYLTPLYDPLALLWAVCGLEMAVGEARRFEMVGGRAYVERIPDQELLLQGEVQPVRVFRLRPGMSLVYVDADGVPVRLSQKVGERVFEASLVRLEREEVREARSQAAIDPEGRPASSGRRRRRRR